MGRPGDAAAGPDERDRGVEALMAATKVITAAVAHSLAAVDAHVSLTQLRVLVMIGANGPMNLSSVADGLGVNASNASRTCDQLVGLGLVDRREDSRDRRHLVLSMTTSGDDLVEKVMRHRRSVLQQVVDGMPPDDRRQLTTALTCFVDAAARLSETGDIDDGEGHLLRWLT
jgi:DNA-binding MarR family transcriptional regulator